MKKYLIRLDDACPTMDYAKWQRIFDILDNNNIYPMVGIIPQNSDPQQMINPENPDFWKIVNIWSKKGYAIALHGYNHCYNSDGGLKGLNPMWSRSEFAGLSLEKQRDKIRKGIAIMREHGINPKYFFAPSHTFDENTLNALLEESDIRIISDTIATRPYRYKDFIVIPQFGGQCREMKWPGLYTFCLHPNTMTEKAYVKVDQFIKKHKGEFVTFDSLEIDNISGKCLFDRMLSTGYFFIRKVRGIR